MSESRIAKRYATPLLKLADELKSVDIVKSDMEQFLAVCKGSMTFLKMLKSPVIPHLKKGEILVKIFEGKVSKLTLAMFNLIVRKNREKILPQIAREFINAFNEARGFQPAHVMTAVALTTTLKSSVEALVKKISGKKPLLTAEVEKNIIGGYILTMDDRQIDQSVKGALNKLKLKFDQESK
jgi:F-type H+-transporting ATPase subunit delta